MTSADHLISFADREGTIDPAKKQTYSFTADKSEVIADFLQENGYKYDLFETPLYKDITLVFVEVGTNTYKFIIHQKYYGTPTHHEPQKENWLYALYQSLTKKVSTLVRG